MSGFTKLVPEICESSIWNQPSDIRIVWITMLAKKDADGYVRGDAQTIARMANVSLESCQEALRLFQQPDSSSHTPDNDGRRIEPACGGWLVLNADKYREEGMTEAQRAYWREQKRLQRKSKAHLSKTSLGQVSDSSASVSASASVLGEARPPWTQEQFAAAAKNLSIPDKERDAAWAYYDSQGWCKANGLHISGDPRSLLLNWKNNPQRIPPIKPKKHAID